MYKGTQKSFSKSAILYSFIYLYVIFCYSVEYQELMAILGISIFLILQTFDKQNQNGMQKISLTIAGFVYIIVFGSYAYKLYLYPQYDASWGPMIVFWTLFICKFSDGMAYFGGKKFGKHKMIQRISPNKTWEGFVCGMVGGCIPAVFIQNMAGFNFWVALQFCFLISLTAVLGDLIESMFKRELNVKDAANDIPAFGGTFDMIDSVLLSLPIAYFFIIYRTI
jgi:phosphatidate cytidylyltransferase